MTAQTEVDAGILWMVLEHGVYVDGQWQEWLPATRTTQHGWDSPEAAVRQWRGLDRPFKAFSNGREMKTAIMSTEHGQVYQRVWFEVVA